MFLSSVWKSSYERILFSSVFSLCLHAFLMVGKIAVSNNSSKHIHLPKNVNVLQRHNELLLMSSKTLVLFEHWQSSLSIHFVEQLFASPTHIWIAFIFLSLQWNNYIIRNAHVLYWYIKCLQCMYISGYHARF